MLLLISHLIIFCFIFYFFIFIISNYLFNYLFFDYWFIRSFLFICIRTFSLFRLTLIIFSFTILFWEVTTSGCIIIILFWCSSHTTSSFLLFLHISIQIANSIQFSRISYSCLFLFFSIFFFSLLILYLFRSCFQNIFQVIYELMIFSQIFSCKFYSFIISLNSFCISF